MNHRNRFQDAGIFLENASPKNLSPRSAKSSAYRYELEEDALTHVRETVGTVLLSVCLLSRFNLEKQASAGMSMATKLRRTQKATLGVS